MEQNISMQQLKGQRLTPAERFVLDTIKGAKAGEPDEYGSVGWYKDGECLFIQEFKIGLLWVDYHVIWKVLNEEYTLNYGETGEFISNVMYKYTNNRQLIPIYNCLKDYNICINTPTIVN